MDLTKMRAAPGFIVARAQRKDEKTTGGIVIPDGARHQLPWGEVVLIGKLPPEYDEMAIQIGDIVFWPGFSGTKKFQLEGSDGVVDNLVVLDCRDIAMVTPKEPLNE